MGNELDSERVTDDPKAEYIWPTPFLGSMLNRQEALVTVCMFDKVFASFSLLTHKKSHKKEK